MNKTLNDQQLKAVILINRPLLINAGPGTGKTKTLTAKIIFLIQKKNFNPANILALTFTNKAANEMFNRINSELTGNQAQKIFIGTFHSFGLEVLKKYNKSKNLELISEIDRKKLIKELINREDIKTDFEDFSIKEISLMISNFKNKSLEGEKISNLVKLYDKELKGRNLIDYDDMISKAGELVQSSEKIRNELRKRYKYILIDEFQDTNKIQYDLIKKISGENSSKICVIGDPLQSIYSFRGARADIFKQFKQDYPDAEELTLQINYRSCKEIIKASRNLFPDSKLLEADNKSKGETALINTLNEYTEADWVLAKISQVIGGIDLNQASDLSQFEKGKTDSDKLASFSDFAVIYRIHGLSRILEQKFREAAIPFQIVGAKSFYERAEIEVIINILKFINYINQLNNQNNQQKLFTLLDSRYLKFSDEFIRNIKDFGIENFDDLRNMIKQKNLTGTQVRKLNEFLNKIDKISMFFKKEKTVTEIIEKIIKIFGIEEFLEDKTDRLNDLHSFISDAVRFNKKENALGKFVEFLEKLEAADYYDEKSDKVTLLTMHAAKGLEFKYVFICGFEEGLIPFSRKINIEKEKTKDEIEEEKRLLYVAMTRAKKGLYLIKAKERNRKRDLKSSQFEQLLLSPQDSELRIIEDEAINKVQRRREIRKAKKAQIKMF